MGLMLYVAILAPLKPYLSWVAWCCIFVNPELLLRKLLQILRKSCPAVVSVFVKGHFTSTVMFYK